MVPLKRSTRDFPCGCYGVEWRTSMPACQVNRSNSVDVKHAALSTTSTRGTPCRGKNSWVSESLHVVFWKWPDKIDCYHLHGRKRNFHIPRRCSSTTHVEHLTPGASIHVGANITPHALPDKIYLDTCHRLDRSAMAAAVMGLADHLDLVPRLEHNMSQQRAPCCGNRSLRKTRPM